VAPVEEVPDSKPIALEQRIWADRSVAHLELRADREHHPGDCFERAIGEQENKSLQKKAPPAPRVRGRTWGRGRTWDRGRAWAQRRAAIRRSSSALRRPRTSS